MTISEQFKNTRKVGRAGLFRGIHVIRGVGTLGFVWNITCYACTGTLGTSNLIHAMCVLGEWGRHQG